MRLLFSIAGILAQARDIYLVKLDNNHQRTLVKRDSGALNLQDFLAIAQKYDGDSFVESEPSKITQEYNFNEFMGFAIKTSTKAMEEIRADPRVEAWARDRPAIFENWPVPQEDDDIVTNWGLDRIHQRNLTLDGIFQRVGRQGEDVTVFVIDSGIDSTHPEFQGRATVGPIFDSDGYRDLDTAVSDDFGHGTHVAGIIASKSYGVAPKAKIVALKIYHESGVVGALQYVAKNATRGQAVINMSISTKPCPTDVMEGCMNPIINAAVRSVVMQNIPVAVAAGNRLENACLVAPAGEEMAFTVGSTYILSNRGPCVDIFAPGGKILSTTLNGGKVLRTGTSMASPHVAGVFATLLSNKQYTDFQALYDEVVELSTKNAVIGLPLDTKNRLLYVQ